MLNTKFKVEINSNGDELNALIAIISNHNGGKAKVDIDVIMGYLLAQQAMLPFTRKYMSIKHEGHAPETIHVSDDGGKTFYISITECTYEELLPTTPEHKQDLEIIN